MSTGDDFAANASKSVCTLRTIACVVLECGALGVQPSVGIGVLLDDGQADVFVRLDRPATPGRPCRAKSLINLPERKAANSRKLLFITI